MVTAHKAGSAISRDQLEAHLLAGVHQAVVNAPVSSKAILDFKPHRH